MRKNERRLLCIAFAVFACSMLAVAAFVPARTEEFTVVSGRESGTLAVPILMYHSVCENPRVRSEYRVSPAMLESDLAYLQRCGYTAIHVADLVAYVYEGKPLPEKPIILTLDDGYLNALTEVLPLLEKYDMRATVSVVGSFSQAATEANDPNPMYAYLTWQDMQTLEKSGRVELGNHTYAMHAIGQRRGCMKVQGESEESYQQSLKTDLAKLQDAMMQKVGIAPLVFTYPYGFISEESVPVLKELGFLAAFSCHERINYINGTTEQLYRLGRFNRTPYLTTKAFMEKVGI